MGNSSGNFQLDSSSIRYDSSRMCKCCCDVIEGAFCCACSLVKWVISVLASAIIIIAIVLCVVYLVDWDNSDPTTTEAPVTTPDPPQFEPLIKGSYFSSSTSPA